MTKFRKSKKANFNSLKQFKDNYKLVRSIIFSSKLFESINKTNIEFPVVIALYQRDEAGMTYEYIKSFNFEILGSNKIFCLNNFHTVDGIVDKYTSKDKKDTDLQFYTIRDINALRRNTTFLTGRCANGVKVIEDDLYFYGWLDLFKRYFQPKDYFLYGNLNPLLPVNYTDEKFKGEVEKYIANNNDIVKEYVIKNEWQVSSKISETCNLDYLKAIVNSLI